MSDPQSKLDLTGQASEDEPASRLDMKPLQIEKTDQSTPPSQPNGDGGDSRVDDDDDDDDDQLNGGCGCASGMMTFLPSPVDLWKTRTPASLALLPIVFLVYVILRLPLHYNSVSEASDWMGRAKDVDKLSSDLNIVEEKLDGVKEEQDEIKDTVADLRRRLDKIKERREARAEYLRQRREEREEEEHRKKEQQGGVAKEGPLSSVTMAKAMAVATFVGKPNVEVGKKDD